MEKDISAKQLCAASFGESNADEEDSHDDGLLPEDFVPSLQFQARSSLPDLIDLKTGEESEEVKFRERAKLYVFDEKSGEFKDRGVGELKILFDGAARRYRVVMRREQVLKLCANHALTAAMILHPMAKYNTAFTWICQDFSDGDLRPMILAARFKTRAIALKFREQFDLAVQHIFAGLCLAKPLAGSGQFRQAMDRLKTGSNHNTAGLFSFRARFPLVIDPEAEAASLSDVKLLCKEKSFNCHRVILAEKSSTFQRLFTSSSAEGNREPVVIDDISGETIQEILRFIYCGFVETDVAHATPEAQYEFLQAAIRYDLKALVDLLTIACRENLTRNTACRYLVWADRFGLSGLKIACFNVLSKQENRAVAINSPEWQEVIANKQLITELFRYGS